MLSDGRVIERPLHKMACLGCGAGFAADPPCSDEIAGWYTEGYGLSAASPGADAARAKSYADWLAEQALTLGMGECLLEVGAGSGRLLQELASRFPGGKFFGCEPSASDHSQAWKNIVLRRGGIDSIAPESEFRTIVAINVIEHTADPAEFLSSLAERLAPGGDIFIVCPDGGIPNLELVFVDHLFSLTSTSMDAIADAAGLSVESLAPAPSRLGLFSLYRLTKRSNTAQRPSGAAFGHLANRRVSYFEAWAELDAILWQRTLGASCAAFGAGQMAALIRAYAPRLWSTVTMLKLDVPSDAWMLGKPVTSYAPAENQNSPMLLATSPTSQEALSRRLSADGFLPVRFDDVISC